MTSAVAKYAAKKMLSGEMNKYKDRKIDSKYDPYYAEIPNPRKPGKFKKVKKQIPAYIPEHDAEILANVRRRAYHLDICLFNLMGIRFGWSSVIGLVPAVGDAIDALLAIQLILACQKVECGLSSFVKMRMLFNMILDFGIGLVPFVGDLADAALKCNSRNVRLLEEELDKAYKPKALIDEEKKMKPERRPRPASVYLDLSDDEERGVVYSSDSRHHTGDVARPGPARVPSARHGESHPEMSSRGQGGGLFSGGSKKHKRRPDEEDPLPRYESTSKAHRSGTKSSRR